MQLIEEKTAGQSEVSCYTIKDRDTFVDFCVGPHVPSTGRLKAFKLLTTSNAYWKGDAKNQPMQRVYGTAFLSESELKTHLQRLEEAKKRDHRKVGKDLGLFMFHKWSPGATFWLAKGTVLWNTLADYMRSVLIPAGYVEVKAPIIFNKALWETSGHWQHYRENMFLVESEGEQMGLKAMNCPGHFLIYASDVRSYRDLPIRLHEQTPLHRHEASGVLSGLTRVRQFSQDDGHCFVMESQIGEEVERLLRLVQRVYGDFGLEPAMKLSTRPAEFLGKIEQWDHAERELRRALDAVGQAYVVNEGDGAFYGPKIDFDVTDAIGRKWQCATIQLDYQMPERFDLKYVGADNAEHRPVVIHRAIFGSFERFIALLIEHYAGAFPLWLAPVQVAVLPIADRHVDYARSVAATSWRRPGFGSRSTSGRRRSDIRSAKPSCRKSRICWSPATARRQRPRWRYGAGRGAIWVRSASRQFIAEALLEVRNRRRSLPSSEPGEGMTSAAAESGPGGSLSLSTEARAGTTARG